MTRDADSYDQAGGEVASPDRAAIHRHGSHFLGLLIFTAGLICCVAGHAPLDADAIPPGTHVPGSSSMTVGTPTVDANGVKYYPVTSIYQGFKPLIVRVVEPTKPAPGKPHRILFVLPVGTGVESLNSTWGDGVEQLRLLDVPNRYNMTLVAPSFSYEPWYGDNELNPTHDMESFVIKDLVPFGEVFGENKATPRLLVGFSKSGYGALELILRHPDVFDGAAVWDCPAQLSALSAFQFLKTNFGTQKNFDQYNIPTLVAQNAEPFRHEARLWISGDQAVFTSDMIKLHSELTAASIPHLWVQGASRPHNWHSGWLNGAIAGLDTLATPAQPGSDLVQLGQEPRRPSEAPVAPTSR